jgi:hypothetical protein
MLPNGIFIGFFNAFGLRPAAGKTRTTASNKGSCGLL